MTIPHTAALLERFSSLAVKRGLLLSSVSDVDLSLLMHSALNGFEPAEVYSEAAVNALLKAWLLGDGRMLRTDHVELRRTLVDLQFLERDGFGRAYRRCALAPVRFREVIESLGDADLNDAARAARDNHERERVRRRDAHQAQARQP